MKKNLALFFTMAILLTGCEWIGGLFTKDISTKLEVDIPVTVNSEKSTSAVAASYEATETLNLEDNDDLADYVENIRDINLNDVRINVGGLSTGQVVTTLSVSSPPDIGVIASHSNITSTTGLFEPEFVNQDNLYKAADKLLEEGEIEFLVTGNVDGALAFLVHLTFDATIKAGL